MVLGSSWRDREWWCCPVPPSHPPVLQVPVAPCPGKWWEDGTVTAGGGWRCLRWRTSLPRAAALLLAPCRSRVEKELPQKAERGGLSSLGVPAGGTAGRSWELKSIPLARAGSPSHSPISSWGLPKLLGTVGRSVCLSSFPFSLLRGLTVRLLSLLQPLPQGVHFIELGRGLGGEEEGSFPGAAVLSAALPLAWASPGARERCGTALSPAPGAAAAPRMLPCSPGLSRQGLGVA